MFNPDADQSPFNSLPRVVVIIAGIMTAVELAFQLGTLGLVGGPEAVGWRLSAIRSYGFIDNVWEWMWANNRWPNEHVLRFVTYPFIHASFIHAAFAVVIILAIGKVVGEVYSTPAFLVIFVGSAIFGALAYGILIDTRVALYGGYPPAYGLIGAFTFMIWVRLTALGENSLRAFTLIGVLMAIQLVFGIFGWISGGVSFDWVADIAGFAAGFGLSFLVSPGAWPRIVAKFRSR